jgi:hypothetical protein
MAEVTTETWLHERTRRRVQGLAGRSQYLMHNRRNFGTSFGFGTRIPLLLEPFFAALLTFTGYTGRAAAGAFALEQTAAHGRERPCHTI